MNPDRSLFEDPPPVVDPDATPELLPALPPDEPPPLQNGTLFGVTNAQDLSSLKK